VHNNPRARHTIASGTESALMTCRTAVDLIPAYLSTSMSASAAMSFHRHINSCTDCAAILRTYRKTIELTRNLLHRSDLRPQPRAIRLSLAAGSIHRTPWSSNNI